MVKAACGILMLNAHTFIKITHQTCMNENKTDETSKQ